MKKIVSNQFRLDSQCSVWPALPCVRLDTEDTKRFCSVGRELPTHLGASGGSLHNSHMFISESVPLIALNVGIPPPQQGADVYSPFSANKRS